KILLSDGSAAHELSGSGPFQNLELDDLQGATLSLTNLTVNGTLTFTGGNITTTTNKVIISSTGAVARTAGHVVGFLQKFVPVATGDTNIFEIGDDAEYAPVSVILTNVTTSGDLIASTTPGDHPDIASSGVSATRGVDRYWTIANNGVLFQRYNALFNFGPSDVDYAANPTNFIAGKRDDAAWTGPTGRQPYGHQPPGNRHDQLQQFRDRRTDSSSTYHHHPAPESNRLCG